MTWNEFLTAISVADATVDVPENTVFNMDDIYPSGYCPTINIAPRVNINGNGLVIKNGRWSSHAFVMSGDWRSSDVVINDTNIIDLLIQSPNGAPSLFYGENYSGLSLRRCNVRSQLSSPSAKLWRSGNMWYRIYFAQCNVDISGNTSSFLAYERFAEFHDCNIDFNTPSVAASGDDDFRFYNCTLTGNTSYLADHVAYQCVYDLKCTSFTSNSTRNTVVVNKELSPNLPTGTNITGMTTADIHDPAMLFEAGIPINPEVLVASA